MVSSIGARAQADIYTEAQQGYRRTRTSARARTSAQRGYRCGRRYLRATSQDIGVCGYRHAHRYLQGPSWHRRSRGYRRTPKSPSKHTSTCGKRIATLGNWRARRYLLGPSNKDIGARRCRRARRYLPGPSMDIGARENRRAHRYLRGPMPRHRHAWISARAPLSTGAQQGCLRISARAYIGACPGVGPGKDDGAREYRRARR